MTRKLLCAAPKLVAVVMVVVACGAAPPARATSALVLPANDDGSGDAAALSRAVETAVLDRMPSLSVITPRSLGDKLEVDLLKACEGGDDATCTAQFSEALGVDLVFRPTLGHVGEVSLLTLAIYDVKTGAVRAQGERRAPRSKTDQLLVQVPELVEEVGLKAALPVRVTEKRGFPVVAATSLGVGGLFVLGGGALAAYGLWQESRYQGATLTRAEASAWEGARPLVFGGAVVVGAVGLVLAGYGVYGVMQ